MSLSTRIGVMVLELSHLICSDDLISRTTFSKAGHSTTSAGTGLLGALAACKGGDGSGYGRIAAGDP